MHKTLSSFEEKISPEYFEIPSLGDSSLGFISVIEFPKIIPFKIKRVYWTYYTPQNVIRGFHAHKELNQLIFAVSGNISFFTEDRMGNKAEFNLTCPNVGLYIPPIVWREIKFSHNAVLLCMASLEFSENDYIRNYNSFKRIKIEK
jgi:dTDP-4-dehydrorhamnose 3,5-epimerase-like enzyme